MSKIHSPHQVLGLTRQASFAEVKAAYRALAWRWHPDRFMDVAEKTEAETRLKLINAAYAQLKKQHELLGESSRPAPKNRPTRPRATADEQATKAASEREARETSEGVAAQASARQAASDEIWVRVAQNAKERLRSRAQALYQEAQSLEKVERYREATDALDKAIRLCPEHIDARQYRGNLYEKRGFALLAERDFAKVRSLKRQARPTGNPSSRPSPSRPSNSSGNGSRQSSHHPHKPRPTSSPESKSAESKSAESKSAESKSAESKAPPNRIPRAFQRLIPLEDTRQTVQRPRVQLGHTGAITAIALLPKNNFVTASRDGSLQLWHAKRNPSPGAPDTPDTAEFATRLAILGEHRGAVLGIAVSPDGQHLASHGEDGNVQLWHWPTASLTRTFATGPLESLVFGPDRHTLTCCDAQGKIRQWRSSQGQGSQGQGSAWAIQTATALALSPDDRYVVLRSPDQQLQIWSTETDAPCAPLDGSAFAQTAICISNTFVAAGNGAGHIFLWQLRTGEPLVALSGLSGGVVAIALSADHQLAAADTTGCIHLVDLSGRSRPSAGVWPSQSFRVPGTPPPTVTALTFTSSGAVDLELISGHGDGSLYRWEAILQGSAEPITAHPQQET